MDVHVVIIYLILCFNGGSMSTCDEVLEPCYLFNTREIPYMDTRHPNISLTSDTLPSKYCDLFALDADTWYRSDYGMTTQAPDQQRCGTSEPIWLNGNVSSTIPDAVDGTVSREACVRSFTNICSNTYTVKIRNCQYYTTYCFLSLPAGCHQRYCFDVNLIAITTSTTTTTTSTSTTPATSTITPSYTVNMCDKTIETVVAAAMLALSVLMIFGILFIVVYFKKVGWPVYPEDNYKRKENSTSSLRTNNKIGTCSSDV